VEELQQDYTVGWRRTDSLKPSVVCLLVCWMAFSLNEFGAERARNAPKLTGEQLVCITVIDWNSRSHDTDGILADRKLCYDRGNPTNCFLASTIAGRSGSPSFHMRRNLS
jgi:hypothetical protein